jgi:dTDP-4-amino-4,6-dideoxygalactose transaminase
MVHRAGESFIGHLAVLTVDDRDAARAELRAAGVATDVHYPVPDHRQDFPNSEAESISLPVTEWASQSVLSVPIFPELTSDEVAQISAALASLGASDAGTPA